MEQIHAKINRIVALLVFAVAFVVFILTASPTVAFWDCGEYVAAGHSLGIPHPPGNPLFMMMLRVTSVALPFIDDIGFRMNILIALMSAFTAMLMYLIAIRVGIAIMGGIPDTTVKRIALYTGGFVGGCFAVFGSTFWFSAVEQSEANPSMLFVALSTWLALVWAQSKDPNRDKYLLLLTFTSFLGIAVHMYSMIVLPPLFLFVMLVDKTKRTDWRLWLTAVALGIVIKDLPLFIFTGLGAVVVTFVFSMVEGVNQQKWRFCFLLSLVAVLGFSSHIYLPIRSAQNPMIDENHPATWDAFKQFLERKQYGSEDMITRMFWRRGTLAHQFGIEERMGYGGFHLTQFFKLDKNDSKKNFFEAGILPGTGKLLIYLIPTMLMIFGWYYLYKRDKKIAIFLGVLFLLTSIGLVFYMNFADGTRPERADYEYWVKAGKPGPMPVVHREVRVRDYFFTAAFMYYGMWIGIAVISILHALFLSKDKFFRTTLAPILSVLFLVSPALPITQNWKESSRQGDYVPYDYAYNLLMSCEKDGILFTNGDNDTFPLWALQEAYGIRKDVRIVNLSLVNTNWYILQMKNLEPKVPISFKDDQINTMEASLNPIEKPTMYTMPGAGITVVLPSRDQKRVLRVQDQMVLNIVDANKWRRPIYFVTSVSEDDLMGLDPYLKMEGMVYRVMPEPITSEQDRINIPRTAHLLNNVYRYTNLENGKANLNETSASLVTNYEAAFIQLALAMRSPITALRNEITSIKTSTDSLAKNILLEKQKEYDSTLNQVKSMLDKCSRIVPHDWRPRVLLHEILVENGLKAEAEKRMREALTIDPNNNEYKRRLADVVGNKEESANLLKNSMDQAKGQWEVYKSLADNYKERGFTDSAIKVLQEYLTTYPGDKRAVAEIEALKK